jgi:ADP-heptose:LPS heptosyltransferase
VKALVICTGGGIGDVLLATPVMRALGERYERVIALTTPAHREVLAGNPALAEVWVDEGSVREQAARIRTEGFDACVVTWATSRSASLPFFAGIPQRVGQARRLYSGMFTTRVTVKSELGDRTTHWTRILLDFARPLGCDVADATPTFVVPESARRTLGALLAGEGIGGRYAVFHPTRGIAALAGRWPSEALGALGGRIRGALGIPLVVTGAPGDREIAEAVAAGSGGLSLAGRTSLAEYGALAEAATAVVAFDSGPMHLAAAVGAPTVGIFALRTDEPDRWAPLGPRTAVVRGTYPCPPEHRKETCPNFACIAELPAERVLEAVEGLLARR